MNIAIYHYLTQREFFGEQVSIKPAYYISHFFGPREVFAREVLEDVYFRWSSKRGQSGSLNEGIGPFRGLEEIGQYAFALCERAQIEGIGLISKEKYNALLEQVDTLAEFSASLQEECDYMKNIDHKKRGLLGKLFH